MYWNKFYHRIFSYGSQYSPEVYDCELSSRNFAITLLISPWQRLLKMEHNCKNLLLPFGKVRWCCSQTSKNFQSKTSIVRLVVKCYETGSIWRVKLLCVYISVNLFKTLYWQKGPAFRSLFSLAMWS